MNEDTKTDQFTQVWEEIGALKQVVRCILDPERVKTSIEIRAAKAETESVVYKYWRRNLTMLASDDALAREYFSLFPLMSFCYAEAKRNSLADAALDRAPQILREYRNLKPGIDAAFERYLDSKIEEEYQEHLHNQAAKQTTSPSD